MKFLTALLLWTSATYHSITFGDSPVRTVICIENDSTNTYLINANGINNDDWAEKIGDTGPVNRPDQNLINKIIHPGKHICVNEDLSLTALSAKEVRLNLSLFTFNGPGLGGGTRRELGSSVDLSIEGTVDHLFPLQSAGHSPVIGPLYWTALASTETTTDGTQPNDDRGFLYPTGFMNQFGEYRQYKKCPPPHKKDTNCQLFLILN